MKILFSLSLFLLCSSCSYFSPAKPQRIEKDLLTEKYAKERKANISNVRYQLQFDLTGKKNFQGVTQVNFDLKSRMYLTLDFAAGEVQEIIVNNEPVSSENYNKLFIELPRAKLKIGANSVTIKYTHDYSKNGSGLYKYVDIKDGLTYMYSQFEPYKANQMFPCFDQPDLKATYATKVLAPKGWEVITATREIEKNELGSNTHWFFPETLKFSTYTFSLHAGDYVMWEDIAKTKNHEIPLRLFARKSLAPFVNPEEWFTLTKQGFVFFEKYFSFAYPYHKYDQVIVPDFNWGAMENVAAVTFNEDRFVSKGEKTRKQKRKLAATLFHEMAHMWFGNLVTMAWWDDLWLNESFATYSSYVGLVEATEFKESWAEFNTRAKQSAYRQDQSNNTHPIAQDCHSTSEAFANFDSITYGKGASVMKQLSYLLGKKTYGKALKNYFAKHAHGNTRLADFMGMMSEASGRDLVKWEDRWLKTAMLNSMEVHFTCKKGRINSFEIYQTGTKDYPMLRSHKTRLALFKKSRGVYKLNKTKSVEYSGERTEVKSLIGSLCPDIVYPNYNDHDYSVVILDKKSLRNIESSLVAIQDPFLRGVLWSDLWQMVLNQKMNMARFLEIVEFNGLVETDLDIVNKTLGHVSSILKRYYPDQGQPWAAQRVVWIKFFEQAYITKINELVKEPEKQKIWFNNLITIAESQDVHRLLEKVLKKHRRGLPLAFPVDQDMRWGILATLMQYDYGGASELLAKESKKDSSKRGQLNSLYAKSLAPDLENKKRLFEKVVSEQKTASLGFLRTIMYGLFPSQQKALHKKFVDKFYTTLKSVTQSADQYYVAAFSENLVPVFCDQKSSTRISNFLKAEKDLAFPIVKRLKNALFENKRCYEMRKLLKAKGKSQRNQPF